MTPSRISLLLLFLASCTRAPETRSSPVIDEVGFIPRADHNSDKVPWASSFVNWSLEKAGAVGTRSRSALSWVTWGVPLDGPATGAIAVLDYGSGRGHVGFVEGKFGELLVILGGDQDDSVSRTAFPEADIVAYRWPPNLPLPLKGGELPAIHLPGAQDPTVPLGMGESRRASASAQVGATVDYELPDRQHLTIERVDGKRVRFRVSGPGSCSRTVAGTAYSIYDGDVEIDAEAGVGYPADQFYFWGDERGSFGLAIRLSLFKPDRARIKEWGSTGQCAISAAIMHSAARR